VCVCVRACVIGVGTELQDEEEIRDRVHLHCGLGESREFTLTWTYGRRGSSETCDLQQTALRTHDGQRGDS